MKAGNWKLHRRYCLVQYNTIQCNRSLMITRKPSCRWQTRATRCNVIVAPWWRNA